MKKVVIFLLVGCLGLSFTSSTVFEYNFNLPNTTILLPELLHEVSGLTVVDEKTLACVQDENGILFLYDIPSKSIKKTIDFHGDGDYEGIAPVGKDMYILRSDGLLFCIENYQSSNFKLDSIQTNIPTLDNEGLCYDKKNRQLLIGAKSKPGKGPEYKYIRAIYGFDLETNRLSEAPVFSLNVQEILQFAKNNNISMHTREGKTGKEPNLKIKISGVFIHPKSKDIYVLSAADFYLFVLDPLGKLKMIHPLNRELFNKAEGIAIQKNGTIFISNEGQLNHPTILQFNPIH
jgi:uncharacterized protein YjiK